MSQSDSGVAPLDIRNELATLWRRRLLVAACVALAAGTTLILSLTETPRYTAEARILVGAAVPDPLGDGGGGDADRQLANEMEFIASDEVNAAVEQEFGRPVKVNLSASEDADLITVAATSTDPNTARRVANTYARVYLAERRRAAVDDYNATTSVVRQQLDAARNRLVAEERPLTLLRNQLALTADPEAQQSLLNQINAAEGNLEGTLAPLRAEVAELESTLRELQIGSELLDSGSARLSQLAETPTAPSSPRTVRNTVVAGVAGLAVGIGLAFVRDHYDDSIRSLEELEAVTGHPVLGIVPRQPAGAELVSFTNGQSRPAEAYRALRTSVRFAGLEQGAESVLVTSARPGEGKTTVAANLAVALARGDVPVALVDGDLRRSRLHGLFSIDREQGFTAALLDDDTDAYLHPVDGLDALRVMPSGSPVASPGELVNSDRVTSLLDALRREADLVIVDSPPLLSVSDGAEFAQRVDATLLVAVAGQSSRRDLRRALDTLRRVNARVLGSVLLDQPQRFTSPEDYDLLDEERQGERRSDGWRRLIPRRMRRRRGGPPDPEGAEPAERAATPGPDGRPSDGAPRPAAGSEQAAPVPDDGVEEPDRAPERDTVA